MKKETEIVIDADGTPLIILEEKQSLSSVWGFELINYLKHFYDDI